MYYKDLIYTDHVLTRMKERGMDIEQIWQTLKYPDYKIKTKTGTPGFKKTFGEFQLTVVAVQNEKYEWVLKSAWREPPLPNTPDAKRREAWLKYRKAGFWGKIWISIKQQIGL